MNKYILYSLLGDLESELGVSTYTVYTDSSVYIYIIQLKVSSNTYVYIPAKTVDSI